MDAAVYCRMAKIRIIAIGAFAVIASVSMAQAASVGKTCQVDFEPAQLKLDGEMRFAEATYAFDDQCKPVLLESRHGKSIPVDARRDSVTSSQTKKPATATAYLAGRTARIAASGSSCTVYLWEEDVVAVKMIGFENFTSWSMDGGAITGGQVTGRSYRYLDWWWFNGEPNVTIGYINEPYSAQSSASANFYCQGIGPVSNYVCGNSPAYEIVLQGNVVFDGGGGCSGTARYSGTVVPAGRVRFQVTRS